MLVENNGSHSFRTAKLGFRTNGGEFVWRGMSEWSIFAP